MARKSAVKTSTISRVAPAVASDPERYCRGLDGWPRSWMGWEKDLPPGEKLVACFRPFLEHLAGSDLSRHTIQKHVDNMWVLGGEIITELNYTPTLREVPVEKLMVDLIKDGGPVLHRCDSAEQQRSFESTCRKFWKFLNQPSR